MQSQFSSVQSFSHVQLFVTPWTEPHQASLSITNSQDLLKLTSILHISWPKYWSFSFIISPSNEYSGLFSFRIDWLDLLTVQETLKRVLQHHSSKASILWHSAFCIISIHDYWKNHTFDQMDLPYSRYYSREWHLINEILALKDLIVKWEDSEKSQINNVVSYEWFFPLILCQLSHRRSPRILEWVAYPFFRGSSWRRNGPGSPALQEDSLPTELSIYIYFPLF